MNIKTLAGGRFRIFAEMPFAENCRMITVCFENRRQGWLILGQLLRALDVLQLLKWKIFSARQRVGQVTPRRIFSGQDTGACGRTDRASRVRAIETDAALCERVDVRRVVNSATLVTDIGPAEIIHQEKDEIELLIFRGLVFGAC